MKIELNLGADAESVLAWRSESTGQPLSELVAENATIGVMQAVNALSHAYEAAMEDLKKQAEAERLARAEKVVAALDAASDTATKAEIIAAAGVDKAGAEPVVER